MQFPSEGNCKASHSWPHVQFFSQVHYGWSHMTINHPFHCLWSYHQIQQQRRRRPWRYFLTDCLFCFCVYTGNLQFGGKDPDIEAIRWNKIRKKKILTGFLHLLAERVVPGPPLCWLVYFQPCVPVMALFYAPSVPRVGCQHLGVRAVRYSWEYSLE